jgi:hypothetical protein
MDDFVSLNSFDNDVNPAGVGYSVTDADDQAAGQSMLERIFGPAAYPGTPPISPAGMPGVTAGNASGFLDKILGGWLQHDAMRAQGDLVKASRNVGYGPYGYNPNGMQAAGASAGLVRLALYGGIAYFIIKAVSK